MGKKLSLILLCIFCVVYFGWIGLLAYLQGGVRIENPACVTIDPETQRIDLAWYLEPFCDWWYTFESGDSKLYRFCYDLPDWLEDISMDIVVSWPDNACILYMGEDRGKHLIEVDYPDADWQ